MLLGVGHLPANQPIDIFKVFSLTIYFSKHPFRLNTRLPYFTETSEGRLALYLNPHYTCVYLFSSPDPLTLKST